MRWTRATAVGIALLFTARLASGQAPTGRIAGAVLDAGTQGLLPSVSVIVVGSRIGVLSGADGRYLIPGVQPGTYTVRAMALGYAVQDAQVQVVAGQTATATFRLAPQAVQLNEVVAVGYGSTRKRDLTGAVSTVKLDALQEAPIASIDQLLAGTAPGVFVSQATSAPGGAISIRIRGAGSLTGNTEPLYVIDGFPVENDIQTTADALGNGGRDNTVPSDPLAALNPSDIESISVLKDASATAIYGARGANGVVMITTKTGRTVKPTVSFDMSAGIQSISKTYDLMNATEFVKYANAYSIATGVAVPYDSTKSYGVGTDWQSQIFRTAPVRDMSMTVTGSTSGANRTRYAISASYFDQQGIVLSSAFNRLSTRLNVDQQVGSRILLSTSLTASRTRTSQVATDGAQNGNAGSVSAALQYNPVLPVKQPDGTYSLMANDGPSTALGAPDIDNPVGQTTTLDALGNTRLLGNAFAEITLLDGLKFRSSFGADYSNAFRNTYYPIATTERGLRASGEARRNSSNTTSWVNENMLTYHRMWGDVHDLTLMGDVSEQKWTSTGEAITNTNFLTDATGFDAIGAGTRSGGPGVSSSASTWTMESVLGRLNYSLMGRYLLTATARKDGSSRFGADHRWGTFPSAALAWRVSDEPFMKRHLQSISEMKLRASYGSAGNPSIRPYQSLARMSTNNYSFGGSLVGGYYTSGAANPNLGWETTKQFDGGLDLGMFEDRMRVTADYYDKETSDLLVQIDLNPEAGIATALKNIGSVSNKGIELAVGYDMIRSESRRGFNWSTEVSYARNRNKVTSLGGVPYMWATTISNDFKLLGTLVQVGQPIGVFYGFKTAGILRDSAAAAAYTTLNFAGKRYQAGDMTYVDKGGAVNAAGDTIPDGAITVADQQIIGDPTPKFTYGWQNTFSYKAISLTGLLQGVYGNKVLNLNLARAEGSPRANVLRSRFLDAWTPTNPNAKYSRIGDDANIVGTQYYTDDMLEDGSYLRLRALTLSVALPSKLVRSPGLTDARVYVTGANLFTITGYSGFNPDVSSLGVGNMNRGVDIGAYPLARSVTFGVSVTY